ncbi:unnamed protein product [Schistosoma curassoni]|nr:unnamed protein product [Schistosoma curassoni]
MKSIYYLILVHVEIKVPESSTLHQCINTKISKYNDIFRLSTLVIEIYEVMKNYNINLCTLYSIKFFLRINLTQ